jgi:uncharacterized protein (TIGR00645 family)
MIPLNPERPLSKRIELAVERLLFASRWLLVPFYLGLAMSLAILLVKFLQEFAHVAAKTLSGTEAEIILGVLSLVDLALTGSLIVIVIFSGYENFVSRIDPQDHANWPEWMASIDFTGLKLKLLSSIVAISGVQVLKQFMSLKTVPDRDLIWYVVLHMVFVASNLLLALSDRITQGSAGHAKTGAAPKHGPDGSQA